MATQTIKLKDLHFLKRNEYVRGTVDKKNLLDLRIIAQDPKHTGYPFLTPIIVRKLDKPGKDGKSLVIVDGMTRATALHGLKRPTIEADVRKMSDNEAALMQFTTNMTHGLRLNRKSRNEWVKHMRFDLGMKLAEIAKEVGMTETSVSRMARDKQTKDGPRKKSAPRVPGSSNGAKVPAASKKAAEWTIEDFLMGLKIAGGFVKEHPETIRQYARKNSALLVKLIEPLSEVVMNAALAIEAAATKAG